MRCEGKDLSFPSLSAANSLWAELQAFPFSGLTVTGTEGGNAGGGRLTVQTGEGKKEQSYKKENNE